MASHNVNPDNSDNDEETKDDSKLNDVDDERQNEDILSSSQYNSLSQVQPSRLSDTSSWKSIVDFFINNHQEISEHRNITKEILYILRDISNYLSSESKFYIFITGIGGVCIFISLPYLLMFGIVIIIIGIIGLNLIILNKYNTFAESRGLVSFLRPGVIRNLLIKGSIVDIFYEVRNSRLGIVDFMLSQVLPLDDPERDLIFEKLPEITRKIATTEGLIYLTPQVIQNFILPQELRRTIPFHTDTIPRESTLIPEESSEGAESFSGYDDDADDGDDDDDDDDFLLLSPHSVNNNNSHSPSLSSSEALSMSLTDGIVKHPDTYKQQPQIDRTPPPIVSILSDYPSPMTKAINKISTLGNSLLHRNENEMKNNKHVKDDDDDDAKYSNHIHISPVNDIKSTQISNDIVLNEIEHKSDEIPQILLPPPPPLPPKHRNGSIPPKSMLDQFGSMFAAVALGKHKKGLQTKEIMAAVFDTRFKELMLNIIKNVWKSPFNRINDIQLVILFISSIGIVSFYFTKNKRMRSKFIKSMKYMMIMIILWIALLSFIELNVRRKSKLFTNIYYYINQKLFHSIHHKAVRERKKKETLKRSKTISMINRRKSLSMAKKSKSKLSSRRTSQSSNIHDLLKLSDTHKRSKFSRTLPNIRLDENEINGSPQSIQSNASSSLSSSESNRSPLYKASDHGINKRIELLRQYTE